MPIAPYFMHPQTQRPGTSFYKICFISLLLIYVSYFNWRRREEASVVTSLVFRSKVGAGIGTVFSGPAFQEHVIQFKPETVFLVFTKTPKTSSTLASSLIASAYVSAGLPVVNSIGNWSRVGKYAAVHHQPGLQASQIRDIEAEVEKPVLLVLSIRDGKDAIMSAMIAAEQYDSRVNMTFDCALMRNPQQYPNVYWNHIKPGLEELTIRPWAIIRHEHVVKDTCCILAALGLKCIPSLATSHRSRKNLVFSHCRIPEVNISHAKQIDAWNLQLTKSRVLTCCSNIL